MHSEPGEGSLNELRTRKYYNDQMLSRLIRSPGNRISLNNHPSVRLVALQNAVRDCGEGFTVFGFSIEMYRHHVRPRVQILLALRGVFVLIVFRETVEVLDPCEREGFAFRFP